MVLLPLFGMNPQEYQRFHNFLAAHECKVDYREFRNSDTPLPPQRRALRHSLALAHHSATRPGRNASA